VEIEIEEASHPGKNHLDIKYAKGMALRWRSENAPASEGGRYNNARTLMLVRDAYFEEAGFGKPALQQPRRMD